MLTRINYRTYARRNHDNQLVFILGSCWSEQGEEFILFAPVGSNGYIDKVYTHAKDSFLSNFSRP